MAINHQVVLAARPKGMPKESDFHLIESPIPELGAGQALVRAIYLSIDPYMRGRISAAKSYAKGVEIGEVMVGGVVGEVVRSEDLRFDAGDIVEGMLGWQEYAAADASALRRVDPAVAPISTALGVLGMPGITAYFALLDVGRPKQGETVLISSAAGAVGSAVGQIARIRGCRAVGLAGSEAKVAYVRDTLGFDDCLDYKTAPDLPAAVAEACPGGVDVYFDNVGGAVHDAAMANLNQGARVVICGTISTYNRLEEPDLGPRHLRTILVNRARLQGFLVFDYADRYDQARAELAAWLGDGRLKHKEDVLDGLDAAPGALIRLLKGENLGKQLVCIGPELKGQP
ncbi:MAG: NADP-dependent oxidoreductase [Kiloniellales bacterium]